MEAPLVSVIVPTYNRPQLLMDTLRSIENQTFKDYEVIVIDDGSPNENSKKVCIGFSKVTYLTIENSGGPARPRNIGIKKAKGKYIAFVDDDDLWLPEKLAIQVAILNENEDFGLVHGPCKVMDITGTPIGVIIGRPGSPSVKHGDVKLRMLGNWTLMTPTVMVRKEVLNRVGFFNERMPPAGEDTEFWTRLSFKTKFYYLDKPLTLYRKHHSNSKIFKNKYIELPIYLKKVLENAFFEKEINKKQYLLLRKYVVHKQIKTIKLGSIETLQSLIKLDPIWFLKFENIKLLVKVVFSR